MSITTAGTQCTDKPYSAIDMQWLCKMNCKLELNYRRMVIFRLFDIQGHFWNMNSFLISNWKQLCKYDKHICVFSEALSKQFKCLKWTIIYPSKNVMHFFDHIWRISPAVFFFFFFFWRPRYADLSGEWDLLCVRRSITLWDMLLARQEVNILRKLT